MLKTPSRLKDGLMMQDGLRDGRRLTVIRPRALEPGSTTARPARLRRPDQLDAFEGNANDGRHIARKQMQTKETRIMSDDGRGLLDRALFGPKHTY